MKRWTVQLAIATLLALLLAAPVAAYDHALADSYATMFAPVQGAKAGKELHLVNPDQFAKEVRTGKPSVMVDIRTPGETQFLTANLPGHLAIPLAQLFHHDQLAKLPTDKPLIVLCKSGARATAAVTGLRQVGFENAYVLKGGLQGLAAYLGPKEANMPLGPKTAAAQ
ncbi:MAG: rhodanese-like domain-containing protein [Gammaproteobacteria bacterium]|nr:rhodanese-like domain-containing protein [Gammaproteobacteria bacterium]